MLRPSALALARAPSAALRENSASAATIAIVFGFGWNAIAASKKGFEIAAFGSCPAGVNSKNLSYLNFEFTPMPNSPMNAFLRCMTTGIAGASIFVA